MGLRVIRMRRKLSQLQIALIVLQADASWFVTPDLVRAALSVSGLVALAFAPAVTLRQPAPPRRWPVSDVRRNPSVPERPDPRLDCGSLLPAESPVGL